MNLFQTRLSVKEIAIAKAVSEMEDSEGWKAFKELAENLIRSYTPKPSKFTAEQATEIASSVVFISGIQRCLGIMEQQKEILKSRKE